MWLGCQAGDLVARQMASVGKRQAPPEPDLGVASHAVHVPSIRLLLSRYARSFCRVASGLLPGGASCCHLLPGPLTTGLVEVLCHTVYWY